MVNNITQLILASAYNIVYAVIMPGFFKIHPKP